MYTFYRTFLCCTLLFIADYAFGQAPENDDISKATFLSSPGDNCSRDQLLTSEHATISGIPKGRNWLSAGKDVWFSFNSVGIDLSVTVTGRNLGTPVNTLESPAVAIYTFENDVLTEVTSLMEYSGVANTVICDATGLKIGQLYYIRVSAEFDKTGSFKLCTINTLANKKAAGDCIDAIRLCSKRSFTEVKVSGPGFSPQELSGACPGTRDNEVNSAWYKWKAEKSGILTFDIIPLRRFDAIDFVLYDIGTADDCSQVTPQNIIRQVCRTRCAGSPIIGLKIGARETDMVSDCDGSVGDGFVREINMIENHIYVLVVNNNTTDGSGFTINFGGTGDVDIDGDFSKTRGNMIFRESNPCTENAVYTLSSNAKYYSSLKWSFGEDANIATSTELGPHTITYSTSGTKTISLEVIGSSGCNELLYYSFYAGKKPKTPVISKDRDGYCIGDVLRLEADYVDNAQYLWQGPDNFFHYGRQIAVPITSEKQGGIYSVRMVTFNCESETATLEIKLDAKPVAAFTTDPPIRGKFSTPFAFKFHNESTGAVRYKWDFGDGNTSTETSPEHTFKTVGEYPIKLYAYTTNGCQDVIENKDLYLIGDGALMIASSFSPNGDGINEEFVVNLVNLRKYNITIVNRNGIRIFESNDILRNWDGTANGRQLPAGVYYFAITAQTADNTFIKKSGPITLIR